MHCPLWRGWMTGEVVLCIISCNASTTSTSTGAVGACNVAPRLLVCSVKKKRLQAKNAVNCSELNYSYLNHPFSTSRRTHPRVPDQPSSQPITKVRSRQRGSLAQFAHPFRMHRSATAAIVLFLDAGSWHYMFSLSVLRCLSV